MEKAYLVMAVAISAVLVARPAHATSNHFISSNGAWGSFGSWSLGHVPQPAEDAIVDSFNGSPGRATVNVNVGAVTSSSIANGDTVAFLNGGTLLVGSGGLFVGTNNTAGILTVINPNPINFYQAGVTITGPVHVGYNSGVGTMTQNDGSVTLASTLYIGSSADPTSPFGSSGAYNFSGGSLKVSDVQVGSFPRSVGTLNVSGTFSTQTLSLGSGGVGSVRQTGGNVFIPGSFGIGSGTYTLTGGQCGLGGCGLGGSSGTARFEYNGGALTVQELNIGNNGALVFSPGANKTLYINAGLYMGGLQTPVTGLIDLADNQISSVVFVNAPEYIRRYLHSAYNDGAWNGLGITSSLAAASPNHNTAIGYGVAGGLMHVKYTYYGDTDLNGVVDFDDYSRTDNGFNNGGTDWLHGDFDYNGIVDFDDYSLIDRAFNTQSGTLRRAMSYLDGSDRSSDGMGSPALRMVEQHLAQFGDAYAMSFLNGVPEPASISILLVGMGALTLSRARRRNHR